ncbi:ATP-binding protein [Devosia sp. LjRoot16]|uniref:sensor histidine kinase n=1 Tax=Devosia sp. LjRoot16 TaxID=3342271 RepID=UPI003ECEBC82
MREALHVRHLAWGGAALLLMGLAGWAGFELAFASAISNAQDETERRLALFDRTLEAIIERFHYLPATIGQAAEAHAILRQPGDEAARNAANGFLSNLNNTAGASETFVMSTAGSVVAASNWWAYDSLVGQNFGHRPYFEDALNDGDGRFYAVGVATGVAGYFLSERIDGPDGPLGVAVAKINLGEIEANWWRSGELIGIVDNNGVVILSTRPDWRYRLLAPGVAAPADAALRYGDNGVGTEPITTDIWPSRGARFAHIGGSDAEASGYFVVDELRLPRHQWRIVSFTPVAPLTRWGLVAAAAAALGCAALVLIAILLIQRQRHVAQRLAEHDRLEQRVAERTEDLHTINEQLRAEIADRVRAEKAEREAQHGLVQAAKMASLGQALAGVAHEVSQPIAALTTHLASAHLLADRRGDQDIAPVLSAMDKVVERLATLTGHLKTFARKETLVAASADARLAIANALDLTDHKLRQLGIDVEYRRPDAPVTVAINPVHLEQVLINLIANAADAMEATTIRVLSIGVATDDGMAWITVADTGAGIAPGELANLFDPFYTTKAAGKGLGLGLSISYGLVRNSGGDIAVTSHAGRGSSFTVTLPLLPAFTRRVPA